MSNEAPARKDISTLQDFAEFGNEVMNADHCHLGMDMKNSKFMVYPCGTNYIYFFTLKDVDNFLENRSVTVTSGRVYDEIQKIRDMLVKHSMEYEQQKYNAIDKYADNVIASIPHLNDDKPLTLEDISVSKDAFPNHAITAEDPNKTPHWLISFSINQPDGSFTSRERKYIYIEEALDEIQDIEDFVAGTELYFKATFLGE